MIPTMRWSDRQGAGWYGAPRGGRTHKGVDIGAYPGLPIVSICEGKLTKIGYPYSQDDSKKEGMTAAERRKFDRKKALRYVQVTDEEGIDFRYFYVTPSAEAVLNALITPGMVIGYAQGLTMIYPGITDHIHFEVKIDGTHVDPSDFL